MATIRKIERKIEEQNEIKTKKRVCAYARVSADNDHLRSSFASQVSFYSEFIQKNKNWDYAGVYSDFATSGTNIKNRKGFIEMIEDCKNGKIDIILTKSISRFARNTVDLLNTVRMLKEMNIEVRFEKENISSLSADGELMLSILAGFAQSESENLSANVKWAIRKRLSQGIDKHRELFGYVYENKEYRIVKEEAKVIKKVYELFLNGLSYTEIANEINKGKIRTRKGFLFRSSSIKDILMQEKYAGYTVALKRYVVSPLTHKVAINKGEETMYEIDGTHPPIVSREDFNKVKERIEYIKKHKNECTTRLSWFSSLVKCPVCGRSFVKTYNNTLRCLGNIKHKNCGNLTILRISDLEHFLDDKNINKIDHIVLKKTRFDDDSSDDNKIDKGDFEIIWK